MGAEVETKGSQPAGVAGHDPTAPFGMKTGPVANKKPPLFWRNPISYLLFLWYSSLLRLGYKRTIQYDDLFDIPDPLYTDKVLPSFEEEWKQQLAAAEAKARAQAAKAAAKKKGTTTSSGSNGKELAVVDARPGAGEDPLQQYKDGVSAAPLLKAVWLRHWRRIMAAVAMQLAYTALQFVGPNMLSQITKFISTPEAQQTSYGLHKSYVFASMMFLAPVLGSMLASQSNRMSIGTQVMVRAELTAHIYRKALRLSTRARQSTETGRVVNHMSADVNTIQSFFYPFATQIITGPCMLIAAIIQLWFQIRWATFIGLAILLFTTPASGIFMKKITGYRRSMLMQTDRRVKLMNQLLVGIRVLKMYAWEAAQEAALLEVRKAELGELGKAIPYRVGLQSLLFAAPQIAMVVCFVVYGSASPDAFTPSAIFTSIALFGLMRTPLIFLPFALIIAGNALVSMRRLTSFFLLEERNEVVQHMDTPGIEVVDGNFFWAEPPPKKPEQAKKSKQGKKKWRRRRRGGKKGSQEAEAAAAATQANGVHANGTGGAQAEGKADGQVAVALPGMKGEAAAAGGKPAPEGQPAGQGKPAFWLRGVNLTVKPGELVCVVGRVGSGKSSLVQALLGEMECASGTVRLGGRLAYAAQQAWIVNGTVKDNVTFGLPFDQARWEAAVEACCLNADLEVLPGGADTEIGEKGINLSGGQKQRISLARALYQSADVYVLDDPLSAVDVHVGKHIFEQFINGAARPAVRLLVTNQLQYVPEADRVVVLEEGRVVASGTYEECMANEIFARLLREHNTQVEVEGEAGADESSGGVASPSMDDTAGPSASSGTVSQSSSDSESSSSESEAEEVPRVQATEGQIEQRMTIEALGMQPGAGGRIMGGVQQARMLAAPTFKEANSDTEPERRGTFGGEGDSDEEQVYGKQLSRFGTMKEQLRGRRSGKQRKSASGRWLSGSGKQSASGKLSYSAKFGSGKEGAPRAKGSLMMKEDQEVGQVTGRVYWSYIVSYGLINFLFLIALWSSEQTVRILTNWWLTKWTTAETTALYTGASANRVYYIGSYVGFALGFVVLTTLRSLNNLTSALRASRLVHQKSLTRLVRAPVTFFDTTPVGRILNRFSKDTDEMDFLLTMSMSEFGNSLFQLLSTIIFLAVIQPWILVGIAPLAIIYYFLQRYYRRSNIELQRQDAVSRSPIYAHFSESLAGVETIRAYGLVQSFALSSDAKVDANHRAYYSAKMANEWLAFRLDCLGAVIVLLAALLAIINRNTVSPALLALTLSESLDVTLFLKSAVTSGAMFETRFNSVERITAYWDLDQEAPPKSKPELEPPQDWPDQGLIEYKDVHMRYREGLDPVLKGVSFRVAPGDKVGIVGRTGSGKSSLIVTLFRIVEPYKGQILLDARNILELGLDDVRGRIAAIPQDPVLFSGSVRTNLDPYSRHTDAELWEVLGHVALKEVVSGLPEGLSARVAENGDNFSVGQRQLLCVARALLRQPRVLVADEATASVDSETDALIQRTIRREFKHCTVLTIAHRINTILDSTQVLVMEDGLVKEYDSVPTLMGRLNSTFRRMVVEAGLEGSASASRAVSRAASSASLAGTGSEGEGEGDGTRPRRLKEGINTFVKRLQKDYDLEEKK